MTTISRAHLILRFTQRKPIEVYDKQNLLISAMRKCFSSTKENNFVGVEFTESERYVLREIFRKKDDQEEGVDLVQYYYGLSKNSEPEAVIEEEGEKKEKQPSKRFEQLEENDLIEEIIDFFQKHVFLIVEELENLLKIIQKTPENIRLSEDLENSHLASETAKEIIHLRQQRFLKDIRGRNVRERSSISRNHISAINDLISSAFNESSSFIIDFTTVDATFIEFMDLDLRRLRFGRNSVEGADFTNTNITIEQLLDVKSFAQAKFDEEFHQKFMERRISEFNLSLSSIQKGFNEAIDFKRSLPNFYLLTSEQSPFKLNEILSTVSDVEIRALSYMMLNDRTINHLPEDEEYNFEWCNENRQVIMTMERETQIAILEKMMKARNYYLPSEVLSLAIDHKLYMLQVSLDEMKLHLYYIMETLDSFPSPTKEELSGTSQSLRKEIKAIYEELETSRVENNRLRIQLFLSQLNLPKDPELGYGPTERLQECVKLAEIIPNTVIDLVGKDISEIDFNKIDLSSGIIVRFSSNEEKLLPERFMDQRYRILFTQARAGRLEELDRYISEGNLNVNYQEKGSGRTALLYACGYGHIHIAKLLIEKYNADLTLKTAFGWNIVDVLASAASQRSDPFTEGKEFLDFLIARGVTLNVFHALEMGDLEKLKDFPDIDLTLVCPVRKRNAWQIAAERGYIDIAQYLKAKKIDPKCDPNPVWLAAEQGHDQVVAEIISISKDLQKTPFQNITPLQIALEKKHFNVVNILFQKDPSVSNDPQVAVAIPNLDAVKEIIAKAFEAIQNPVSKQNILKLLFYSLLYERDTIFKQVLSKCGDQLVDFNYRFPDSFHRRLVDQAVYQGNLTVLKLLMQYKHKFDLNACTTQCPFLLYTAINKKDFKIMFYLLDEVKVDVKLKHMNKNMLHHLMIVKNVNELERIEVAQRLVSQGCSVFDIDSAGNTVLHYAATVSSNMMRLIMEAQLNAVNLDGKTVQDIAKEAGIEVQRIL